jgi:predicted  nucleic acid-binding Zn-ribbon protein
LTIKNEILRKLREGIPLKEVKEQFRSQSQLYDAIREFLEEASNTIEERQMRLRKAEEDSLKATNELQRLDLEKNRLQEEVAGLGQTKQALAAEASRLTGKRNYLLDEMKKLELNGFTPQIMEQLDTIVARSGQELVLQVETAEKYAQLRKEFSCLRTRTFELRDETRALETKKRNIEQQASSEKNALDELKVQTASFREAVAVAESLLEDGYTTEDVKSLKHGLDVLGIKGRPHASVTRIINGLAKLKSLMDLEGKLCRRRGELAALNRDKESVKSELETAKELTLKTIEEIRVRSVQMISNTAQQSSDQMGQTAEKLAANVTESLVRMDAKVREAEEIYKTRLNEVAELECRKAAAEEALGQGLVLVGMLRSLEYLRKVPVAFMVDLLDRIQIWCELNFPTKSVTPHQGICAKDYNLMTVCSYKLPVLIELAKEGLKQTMLRQEG